MSKTIGEFQKLSRQSNGQKSTEHEEEQFIDTKTVLDQAQHSSGQAIHNSVLQLQQPSATGPSGYW